MLISNIHPNHIIKLRNGKTYCASQLDLTQYSSLVHDTDHTQDIIAIFKHDELIYVIDAYTKISIDMAFEILKVNNTFMGKDTENYPSITFNICGIINENEKMMFLSTSGKRLETISINQYDLFCFEQRSKK